MMILNYSSKKLLKTKVGEPLNYDEVSLRGLCTLIEVESGGEYKRNGTFCGSNYPWLSGIKGREFFAEVTMLDGLIEKVK